jgi:hypothetical protein
MKRRQPPDVSSDGLNCILNFCDCSVAVVGGERLPSSINSAFASPAFSRFLLLLSASSPLLPSTSTMGKSKKGDSSSHHSGDKRKREPTPPSEDFGDSEYSEEEFSSEFEGSPAPASPSVSSDGSDDSQGIPRRYGPTSGSSSMPGSRAWMSRSTPRMRRTPLRRAAAATVTVAAAAARPTAATAAARAATRPVARCHWF